MSKATTYKSDPLAAVHETASDMFEAGVIDKQIMRHFDESCLTPMHPFSAKEIKALREHGQKKLYKINSYKRSRSRMDIGASILNANLSQCTYFDTFFDEYTNI